MARRVNILGSTPRERLIQDAISRNAREVDSALVLSYGKPRIPTISESGTYRMNLGDLVRIDGGPTVDLLLPSTGPKDIGKAITIVNAAPSSSSVTLFPGGDLAGNLATINGESSVTFTAQYAVRQAVLVTTTLWVILTTLDGTTAPPGGAERWEYLSTTNPTGVIAPTCVFQFDGGASSLTDRTGTISNLTVFSAPNVLSTARKGLFGYDFNGFGGTGWLYGVSSEAAMQITGALTLEVLHMPRPVATASPGPCVLSYGTETSTGAPGNNQLYSLYIGQDRNRIRYRSQDGGGGTQRDLLISGTHLMSEIQHTCLTRDSVGTAITAYQNGVLVGSGIAAAAPTGGTGTRLSIGTGENGTTSQYEGVIFSARITAAEMSAAQVAAAADQVMGRS